jgi:membrane protein
VQAIALARAGLARCREAAAWIWARPLVQRLARLVRNLDRHDAPRAASAMAFDAFLGIIPLLAFGGWIMGRLHQRGDLVVGPILRSAPSQVAKLADDEMGRLSDGGMVAIAPVVVLAFLWASSAGVSTAMGVCETMYASKARAWYVRRLIAIGCVLGSLAAVALAATVAITIGSALGPTGAWLVGLSVPGLVVMGLVIAFYRIAIVRPRGVRRRVLPGTLLTMALWGAVTSLFTTYVDKLARYSTLYGGLAAVAVTLVWLWLLALALLVGGELNADLEGIRGPASTPLPLPRPPTSGTNGDSSQAR